MIGHVGVGGKNPIRIQSMTTSDTRDVPATVEQIMKLSDAGCEIVRVTVQGKKEAEACEEIKGALVGKGYTIPVVADIHFYPPAAMMVVDFVDKIRINPGNFVDKRASFKELIYNDQTYAEELKRIKDKFAPLVEKCKRLKKAIRIGTNHGSLSDRIMNRYGDSPKGMVESALEFAWVCRELDFHDLIFSMKASNTHIMIEAYRLLVSEMNRFGWDYPLHLGVTEAGEGEEGRVKSAIGIGSLLIDGLGDTIRVSLTEDPWNEIVPCKILIKYAEKCRGKGIEAFEEEYRRPDGIVRRKVDLPSSLHPDGSVVVAVSPEEIEADSFYSDLGCSIQLGRPMVQKGSVDVIISEVEHEKLNLLREAGMFICSNVYSVDENARFWPQILKDKPKYLFFAPKENFVHNSRKFFEWLRKQDLLIPVILQFSYSCSQEDLPIYAAADYGSLLCDGLGEGICLEASTHLAARRSLSFAVLQGARMRSSKTEFISCPGCGRTLFDLQAVTKSIREKTAHLPGVKIAVMGCIVNGPGEMADADFGYVGSLPGKIDLYVGKQRVEKHIPMEEAVDRLIALIQKHGRWVEPQPL